MNTLLELAPFPSRDSKIKMILLLFADFFFAFLVDRLCVFFLNRDLWIEQVNAPSSSVRDDALNDAADEEEVVLKEETKEN
eukprot:450876-Ditylum_brightwellii.AAC.1